MADIPKGGFKKREPFETWLNSLPEPDIAPFAIALAHRAAMRVLPFIAYFKFGGKDSNKRRLSLTLASFRANLIAGVACCYPTPEVNSAALSADSADLSADSAGSVANSAALSAGSAALSAAALSTGSAAGGPAAALSAGSAAISAAYSAAAASAARAAAIWRALTSDAEFLQQGGTVKQLTAKPVWLEGEPDWWRDVKSSFQAKLAAIDKNLDESRQLNWLVWLEWYNARAASRAAFDLPLTIAKTLEMRIALGDNGRKGFWEREPHEVNAEIAGWVDAERELLRLQTEAALGQRPAIHQFSEVAGRIVATPLRSVVPSSDFNQALWSELSDKIENAKTRVASTQVPKHVLDSIERLRAALGDSFSEVSPGILLMRSRTLEAIAATYAPDDMRSEVSGEVLAMINDLADSLSDFRAVFPEILEIEAARLAQQIAADNSNVVRNEALNVANIAKNSDETDASVTAAFKIAFDEILGCEPNSFS
jgi:hypothetical protein